MDDKSTSERSTNGRFADDLIIYARPKQDWVTTKSQPTSSISPTNLWACKRFRWFTTIGHSPIIIIEINPKTVPC